jgi:hypothetical protein
MQISVLVPHIIKWIVSDLSQADVTSMNVPQIELAALVWEAVGEAMRSMSRDSYYVTVSDRQAHPRQYNNCHFSHTYQALF